MHRGRRGGLHWKGAPPIPSYVSLTPNAKASVAFGTDSNHPQPLWQPPPTACLTASRATSEVPSLLMHPGGGGGSTVFKPYATSNAAVYLCIEIHEEHLGLLHVRPARTASSDTHPGRLPSPYDT